MKIGISLRAFPPSFDWRDCLAQAARAGFDGVEVNFDGRFPIDSPPGLLAAIRGELQAQGLEAASVYSRDQWRYPITSADPARRRRGIDTVARLIGYAQAVGAPRVLVIPGAVDNSFISAETEIVPYQEAYERAVAALQDLAPAAQQAGVVLAVENVANRMLQSPLEMRRFVEQVGSPAVGCYLDTANCLFLGGYPEHWIRILGPHLQAVHLKDYRLSAGGPAGFVDLFEGDTRWPEVCRALVDAGYDGYLVSEVLPAFSWHPQELWLTSARRLALLREDIRRLRSSSPS